jgi:hypothetical protein
MSYDDDFVTTYGRRLYNKVYIPTILKINKKELQHYDYVETVQAGVSTAHIIKGADEYFLCISKNDNISVEERIMEPIGFRRKSIQELKSICDIFNLAYDKEKNKPRRRVTSKYPTIIVPPKIDHSLEWREKFAGHKIVNIITKETYDLSMPKIEIMKHTSLTSHLLDSIIYSGSLAKNWCYYGERLDKLTWDEYFSRVTGAGLQTQLHQTQL